jgi:ParB/RepB/Spo0J family partition protein
MAKNFSNAGASKSFSEVAAKSEEKASVVVLQNIATENLIDNPKNGEDITYTADLEQSMKEVGFTDPIEVTDFQMTAGMYMILSGHRRRAAGVNVGITVFPCLVRHFQSEAEVQNYTLLANSQRDSARDPLLFCKRYKMHEQYLKESGFAGKIREEVAKRLGISVQHADRFNTMNRVILTVWDMVRAEQVGMSAVLPLASHTEDEQKEIVSIMQDAQKQNITLTRETVKRIVEGYRDGKRTWAEIANLPRDSGLPLNGSIDTEPGETPNSDGERDRNDEVNREVDPIAAEADAMDKDRAEWEEAQEQEREPQDKDDKELTEDEKKEKLGRDIQKAVAKLESLVNSGYYEIPTEEAKDYIGQIAGLCSMLIDETFSMAEEHGMEDTYRKEMKSARQSLNNYCKKQG